AVNIQTDCAWIHGKTGSLKFVLNLHKLLANKETGTPVPVKGGFASHGATQRLTALLFIDRSIPFATHFPAFRGTLKAGFRTSFAMIHIVFCALIAASRTDFSANTAKFFRGFTADAHHLAGRITDGCAFHIKLNTCHHHFCILFLQAGRCTLVADKGTPQARINASLVLLIHFHKKK
ncbi:MAG: hypothetical protein Q7T76_22180, partial [Ferruginibacter sp.]|nr:hypothetical protein [Ferruginibacter sp.]